MKKKVLVMIIACCMMIGLAACGKDTKVDADTKVESDYEYESIIESPYESSVSLELGDEEEGELTS